MERSRSDIEKILFRSYGIGSSRSPRHTKADYFVWFTEKASRKRSSLPADIRFYVRRPFL